MFAEIDIFGVEFTDCVSVGCEKFVEITDVAPAFVLELDHGNGARGEHAVEAAEHVEIRSLSVNFEEVDVCNSLGFAERVTGKDVCFAEDGIEGCIEVRSEAAEDTLFAFVRMELCGVVAVTKADWMDVGVRQVAAISFQDCGGIGIHFERMDGGVGKDGLCHLCPVADVCADIKDHRVWCNFGVEEEGAFAVDENVIGRMFPSAMDVSAQATELGHSAVSSIVMDAEPKFFFEFRKHLGKGEGGRKKEAGDRRQEAGGRVGLRVLLGGWDGLPAIEEAVFDGAVDSDQPRIGDQDLLSVFFSDPSGPPRVAAVGDDVVFGEAHEMEVVERVGF